MYILKKIALIFILFLIITNTSYATNEIISSQAETLNIYSFIKEGQNFTKDVFPDINLKDFFNSSLSGNINNSNLLKGILNLFASELVPTISLLGSILIVIIIHSILKNFIENFGNKEGIGQIAYYVEYILIVTLIMSNFGVIIKSIQDSISNLVGFINSLIPILLALMSASRKYNLCFNSTTYNYFKYSVNRKYNKSIYTSINNCCNNNRNSF